MRILFVSDNPLGFSAYGQDGKIISGFLSEKHEVTYFAPDYKGLPMGFDNRNLRLVGSYNSSYELINYYVEATKPDVIITFKDPSFLPHSYLRKAAKPNAYALWIPIVPIDTSRPSPMLKKAIDGATHVISLTPHQSQQLTDDGIPNTFIPLANETLQYTDNQLKEKRLSGRAFNYIQPYQFVFLWIGKDLDDRKNVVQVLTAWSRYIKERPDDVLYMHTDMEGENRLNHLANMLGIPEYNIRFTPLGMYRSGMDKEFIHTLYCMSDVLVSVGNEGWSKPTTEAAMFGLPSISIDFAALTYTFCGGILIPCIPDDVSASNLMYGQYKACFYGDWRFEVSHFALKEAMLEIRKLLDENPDKYKSFVIENARRFQIEPIRKKWLEFTDNLEKELYNGNSNQNK